MTTAVGRDAYICTSTQNNKKTHKPTNETAVVACSLRYILKKIFLFLLDQTRQLTFLKIWILSMFHKIKRPGAASVSWLITEKQLVPK